MLKKLKTIAIPEMTFRPPATLVDVIDFFRQASRDYDDPKLPEGQRGVNLILKLPSSEYSAPGAIPVIPAMSARHLSLFDALKLVCDVTGMKFSVRGNIVMVVPLNDPDAQAQPRSKKSAPHPGRE